MDTEILMNLHFNLENSHLWKIKKLDFSIYERWYIKIDEWRIFRPEGFTGLTIAMSVSLRYEKGIKRFFPNPPSIQKMQNQIPNQIPANLEAQRFWIFFKYSYTKKISSQTKASSVFILQTMYWARLS